MRDTGMSGRDTVKNLRLAGDFSAPTPSSSARRVVVTLVIGVALGAMVYLLAVFVVPRIVPAIMHLGEKPQPPAHYARPSD